MSETPDKNNKIKSEGVKVHRLPDDDNDVSILKNIIKQVEDNLPNDTKIFIADGDDIDIENSNAHIDHDETSDFTVVKLPLPQELTMSVANTALLRILNTEERLDALHTMFMDIVDWVSIILRLLPKAGITIDQFKAVYHEVTGEECSEQIIKAIFKSNEET